ncbi:Aste57867_25039 [Aphanomyces stellatus]|uniref:Aste57867_25039 protein n=1 Tax=Aphanomyces stellatus TaxID=120398 RepID=A0A485LSS3_9STRA|nr:hypothetical protein As57867_024961 [Aphanomyces stellatus]VFU01670.1 Aste57867_25039 [Aphanomyces stellatus]
MSLLGAEYSDSSSSDEEVPAPKKVDAPAPKSSIALPPVDDIFKETKAPSFLQKATTKDIETFDIDEETLTKLPPRPVERSAVVREEDVPASSGGVSAIYQFPGLNDEERVPRRTKHLPKQRMNNNNGNPKRKADHGGASGDKTSGKERVKQQRLKGQSGIGSEFKTWKSETEMKMRQEFD